MASAASKRGLMIGCSRRLGWTALLEGNIAAPTAANLLFNKDLVSRSSPLYAKNHWRSFSQLVNKINGKRAFLVDTLALVRRLEAQGIPSKHAEAITSAIIEVLNDSLENVAQSFVSQGEMHKEHHFAMLQRETDKLKSDIDKMRSELRYEIDKVTAGLRLDLNLERGRTRDELAKQSAETSELTNKLDREIHSLKAQLEAAKYEVIKYCIGTLVSITAVGLAVVRILM